MQSEILISPELALVDPELAAFGRRLLGEPGDLARRAAEAARARALAPEAVGAIEEEAATVPERRVPQAVGRVRARALAGLAALSIGLNLLLAVMLLSEEKSAEWGQVALGAGNGTALVAPSRAAVSSGIEPTSAKAERGVLAGLSTNPRLRKRFVDSTTGLPLGPVSASCRPRAGVEAEAVVYRCVISERRAGRLVTDVVDYPASSELQATAQGRARPPRSGGTSSASPDQNRVAAAHAPSGKPGGSSGDQSGQHGRKLPASARVH